MADKLDHTLIKRVESSTFEKPINGNIYTGAPTDVFFINQFPKERYMFMKNENDGWGSRDIEGQRERYIYVYR